MTKITSLSALTGAGVDTAVDVIPIVDISAGASGNKKITVAELKTALAVPAAYTAENARDDIAAALVAGANITITPNDGADTITIAASSGGAIAALDEGGSLTAAVTSLDFVGAGVTASNTGGAVTVTIAGGGGYNAENARDDIGAALVGGSGITVTVNDGADTITIARAPSAIYEDQKAANTAGGPSVSGSWIARVLNTEVYDDIGLALYSATITVTIATPGVVTWTAHGLILNSAVVFTTTGALPTGLTAGTTYYVISAGLTANTFQVSATVGGSAINTTGSQSGVHTATASAVSLAAGTYEVDASSNFFSSNMCRIRIRDVTNSVTLALSDNMYASSTNAGSSTPRCLGRFTLAGTALVELQYRAVTAAASNGLGVVANFGEVEIYSRMKLTKLS